MQTLKSIFLWCFLPIHFYLYIRRRCLLNKWISIILILLSPITIIFFILISILIIVGVSEYTRNYHYTRRYVLNEVVGVKLPKYKVTKKELGNIGFNRDRIDYFFLEFKNDIPQDFTSQIDSLVNIGKGEKINDSYKFYKHLKNLDMHVEVVFKPRYKTAIVTCYSL